MNSFFLSSIFLLISSMVACSSSSTTETTPISGLGEHHPSDPKSQVTLTAEPFSAFFQESKEPDQVKQFSDAPDRNLYRLTNELVKGNGDLLPAIGRDAKQLSVGHTERFWLVDLSDNKYYKSDFTLVLITPHAYWYVENDLNVNLAELEWSAADFETNIYPVITRVFGNAWGHGIDTDLRLSILNARLSGVAGYFSSTDKYPASVRPKSNQREIIYMNAQNVRPGNRNYSEVLSHELQHVIHWNADASEDTWVNEGLSELATSITSQSTLSIRRFLRSKPVSLIHWPPSTSSDIVNYGASSLFMHFFTEHYGGQDDLKPLVIQPEDGIAGINQYLKTLGYDEDFNDVFKKWATANILDEHLQTDSKILGYYGLDIRSMIHKSIHGEEYKESRIPQYAVEYIELDSGREPFQLSFRGDTEVALLPVNLGEGSCWWSNSGDSIDSTLSHNVEIPLGSTATLEYNIWFDIEEDWDYVYIEVSVDGGDNWQILEPPETSTNNPLGNAFGAGYTGKSVGWRTESVDLTEFSGENIWVRFQYVTDDAVNGSGACIHDLSISTAGITVNESQWDAHGFVFTNNVVRQNFQVQLITVGDDPRVLQLSLDASNSGKWIVQPPKFDETLILAVGSLAEKTQELAQYTVSLTPNR